MNVCSFHFLLWVFELEMWNDYHALRLGLDAWQRGIKALGHDLRIHAWEYVHCNSCFGTHTMRCVHYGTMTQNACIGIHASGSTTRKLCLYYCTSRFSHWVLRCDSKCMIPKASILIHSSRSQNLNAGIPIHGSLMHASWGSHFEARFLIHTS